MLDYWYIWYTIYEDGKPITRGRYTRSYRTKSSARRKAKQMWGDDSVNSFNPIPGTNYIRKWIVSETNPWGGE